MMVTHDLLRAFPLLSPLSESDLDLLAEKSSAKKYARREIVLNARERGEVVCFLFEGRLQGVDFTIDGREVGLYFIEPKDFCGELLLFDEQTQPEFIIALTKAVVVEIPIKILQAIMLKNSSVMGELGKRLAARVRQMTYQRSLLGLPNIGQRVCCQLWLLLTSREEGEAEKLAQHVVEILNPPTHMEIAIMLNLSRETVTRVFQTLQNRQIVRRAGATTLIVENPALLKQFADGSEELG